MLLFTRLGYGTIARSLRACQIQENICVLCDSSQRSLRFKVLIYQAENLKTQRTLKKSGERRECHLDLIPFFTDL